MKLQTIISIKSNKKEKKLQIKSNKKTLISPKQILTPHKAFNT